MTALDAEFNAELTEIFREEATTRLDQMDSALLAMEAGHADAETIDALFRNAHTIKGSAGMLGFEDVRSLGHAVRSNENFLRLQDELAGTENRIAIERRKYNETLQSYNTAIQLFPNNIVAGMSGFERNDAYFKTEPGARTAPKVAF